jgi:hypothetical protein
MRTHENVQGGYSEIQLKALAVHLILDGKAEEALEQLAKHYNVNPPRIKVGLPEKHGARTLGCYTLKNKTIHVSNSDVLKNPFVILHEFYHHLRTSVDKKHRGTEKYASQFARDFIRTYENLTAHMSLNNHRT